MNEERPENDGGDSTPSSSRWAIAPNSVVNSLSQANSQNADRAGNEDEAKHERGRSVADILAEARRQDGHQPRRSRGRSKQSIDDSTRVSAAALPPVSAPSHAPSTASLGSNPAPPAGVWAAAKQADPPKAAVRARVVPDLGESREMRPSPDLGTTAPGTLVGFGGVLLLIVITGVGALIDRIISGQLGIVTGIALWIGTFLAALITRKRDLLSIIVAPPIVYAAFGFLVVLMSSKGLTVTGLAGVAFVSFPYMAIGSGIAALVAAIKLLTTRTSERA
ncbi:MAG: DUF6542 domain-containing protein [Antricoccus sp.]